MKITFEKYEYLIKDSLAKYIRDKDSNYKYT